MTSDSIRTRPRMSAPRTSPAAPGFRAIASAAALTALPCPSAASPAARPSEKPAVMIDHLAISRLIDSVPAPCANSGVNTPPARTSATVRTKRLLTTQTSSENLSCSKCYSMKRKNNDRRRLRGRGRLMPARRVVPVRILVVFDGHCPLQIDDRQQHEDECLQPAGDHSEKHHRQRYKKRNERKQDEDDHLFAEDVAEETERQRHHAGAMADDLDREIQDADPPRRTGRRPEVLHIADDALGADAVEVVVDPRGDRAAERDVDVAGGGHQSGDQPHVVPAQDKDAEGRDERQKTAPFRTNPLLEQVPNRGQAVLEDDLQLTGVFDAQS